MNKQELHNKLSNVTDSVIITSQEFIEVYRDMRTIKDPKNKDKTIGRPDILAKTYNLNYSYDLKTDLYTFSK